jgi:hypothetical protein
MTRPCRWPDGGCGADIIDVRTIKGAKQVLDAEPTKGIVMVDAVIGDQLASGFKAPETMVSRVVNVWTDHHATCSAFKAYQERRRANA